MKSNWFIPGYSGNSLIAIKVKVEKEVGDFQGIWVDEPIGHAVGVDEIISTRRKAVVELKKRINEARAYGEVVISSDLSKFRKEHEAFIASTWEENGQKWSGLGYTLEDKKENVDWFGPQHIKA